MEATKHRMKISVLWLAFAVSTSAAMIIWFVEPGIIEQIMTTGEMITETLSEGNLVFFALYWLIPLSMAFLTQILKYSLNRWLNFVLGIIFAILTIYYFVSHLMSGWFTAANSLILMFSLVITILIAWYAWDLPKEKA